VLIVDILFLKVKIGNCIRLKDFVALMHTAASKCAILIIPQSATAMRFVWNLFVFGIKILHTIDKTPKAILVYQT